MATTTRFLVIADTHGNGPYTATKPAPLADSFIHCGDLTQIGGLGSFKRAITNINTVDAPLKLVITGNHDLELDEQWVPKNMEDEAEVKECRECLDFLKAQQKYGNHYLEEGIQEFELKEGRRLRVYADPRTPEFNGYVFAYAQSENPFISTASSTSGATDIAITHGPSTFPQEARYLLDKTDAGVQCGCAKLATATQNMRPRLHCFGHIHEGRGAMQMDWPTGVLTEVAVCGRDWG